LVIEAYVKAYQTAELDEQMARMEQLSDGELMKIAMGGQAEETVSPVSRLLTVRLQRRKGAEILVPPGVDQVSRPHPDEAAPPRGAKQPHRRLALDSAGLLRRVKIPPIAIIMVVKRAGSLI
jgi:hypothetical protein